MNAAQARRVDDQARGGLDGARIVDVERDQPGEPGVADGVYRRVTGEAARELAGALGLAAEAELQRLEAAEQRRGGVGGGDDPRLRAGEPQRLGLLGIARDGRPEQSVVVAREVLRRRVDDDVRTLVERAEEDGSRDGRVAHPQPPVGAERLPVRHAEHGVRGGLDPDDVGIRRRLARLVELDEPDPPGLQPPEEHRRAEVGSLRERDRRPRAREGEHDRRRGAGPGRVEQRVAALERAQPRLRGGAGRVSVARVVEAARLAALVVRPDRRAVDGVHATNLPPGYVLLAPDDPSEG